ncbi:MAG TPA: Gfo/Idh/MocA family oxidoreductase [Candidatus Limnocylindrales bacterium]|nr:Gfo/Idh/MocA family oxidoreductase [Candidatus Limnocylindrales bacterium]
MQAAHQAHGSHGDARRRLRVALFGAGLVGQASHAPTLWDDRDRWDFVAVADPSRTVREAIAERYGVPNACASLDEALALGLDAVVIAVPDPAHTAAVLTALAAGCHVFCEKPLAISVAECDEILASRGDRVVQVGYMKLFDPAVERLVERLDGSEIVYLSVEVNDPDQAPFVDHLGMVVGRDVSRELIEATGNRHRDAVREALGHEPDAAQSRAFDAYLSSLVHDVSLAHHLLGSVGIHAPLPLADAAYFDAGRGVSLDWVLPADGRAHLEHLNLPGVSDYRERVTVACRDRILELTFPSPYLRHFPTRLVERRSDGGVAGLETIERRVSYEESFRNELRAFHAAITTGAPVRATVEAARDDVVALLDAFRLAASRRLPESA